MTLVADAFASLLVHSLLQISLVGAAAFLLPPAITHTSSRLRHAFWSVVLLACLGVSIFTTAGVVLRDARLAAPWEPSEPGPSPAGELVLSQARSRAAPLGIPRDAVPYFAWSYFVLVALGAGRLMSAALATRAILRRAEPRALPEVATLALDDCVRELDVPAAPQVLVLDGAGPATCGWNRPTLLVPKELLSESDPNVWRCVFAHELAHVRRRDFLRNLLWELAIVPFWFHPAIRWSKRNLDVSRELVCDDSVAGRLVSPGTYARTLLNVANLLNPNLPDPTAIAVSLHRGRALKERIMRLLGTEPTARRDRAGFVISVALLAATAVAGSTVALPISGATSERGANGGAAADSPAEIVADAPSSGPAYSREGRRDPFLSPVASIGTSAPAGFDVESVELQGIVKTPAGYTGMLVGPDQKTYFVQRGERFFNGTLVEITESSLTFRVQDRSPLSIVTSRDVVLPIHPTAR